MDINRANLEALFQTYSTAWAEGMKRTMPVDLGFLRREFPSMSAANFYGFLDLVAGFREWVGDRIWNDVRSQKYVVPNRIFETSTSVGRQDIMNDQYGIYGPIIQMKAEAWPELLATLIVQALILNPKCFTEKAFFATNHALGKNTLSNKSTDALTAAAFEAAILAAAEWKYSNGELIKPRWTHLVVGEKLRSTAFGIVKSDKLASIVKNVAGTENVGGTTIANPNYGRAELVVLPDLAGDYDDYWMLLDCSRPMKPVALQIREVPKPKMDTDPDIVEKSGKVDFFGTGQAAAAPTFPWLAYAGIL
jgi:phage major head subunit gpT-like protein